MRFRWLFATPAIRGEKMIKNIDVPACRNCVYYKPNTYGGFTSSLNRCEKFGTKDIVTDEIHYDFADLCRKDETKCGKEGKYFVIEENLPAKQIRHFLSGNAIWWVPVTIAVLLNTCLIYAVAHP